MDSLFYLLRESANLGRPCAWLFVLYLSQRGSFSIVCQCIFCQLLFLRIFWGRVVLRVCSAIFGWEKHGMQVSSGVRGNVAGQLCVGFSVLSKWLQTPRRNTDQGV